VAAPHLQHLIQMVGQNASRLERIVDEVLNISRVPANSLGSAPPSMVLNETVERICRDWSQHAVSGARFRLDLCNGEPRVLFDSEHMRRVLVNLLDNARRYASDANDAIQVFTALGADRHYLLSIWSDGAQMEESVERHLFEPFFSSESRSTGLGLYICRELCEGHGATIGFKRSARATARGRQDGNEFRIALEQAEQPGAHTVASDRTPSTTWQQHRL
ncbi:MAG: HAMP domain-containing sensor histidine kinase, partial [Burkholderiaceae bacterium]